MRLTARLDRSIQWGVDRRSPIISARRTRPGQAVRSGTTLLKDSAMKHSQISRNFAKAFFAFSALAIVSACADTTALPTPDAPAFVAPANFLQVGSSITFRVDNAWGTTQRLDDHVINIQPGAICDIATS